MGYNKRAFGVMAQLVERLVRNEEASGSNPLSSTKIRQSLNTRYIFINGVAGFAQKREQDNA